MAKGMKGTGQPFLRGKIWWIKFYANGNAQYESSGSMKKSDAVRLLNTRRAEAQAGRIAAGSAIVDDLFALYLSDLRRNRRRSFHDAENNVRTHLLPAFGSRKANELTSIEIDRFIELKQQQGFSNASINRYLSSLKRAFKLGAEATPPLVTRLPKIHMLQEDNVREGFLDHRDYERLRDLLPDHQKLVFVIAYHLGLRVGEILKLRWDQVDWLANLLRLERRQTKAKQARQGPLYGDLRLFLEMAYVNRGECPFVVSYDGHSISETKRAWSTARNAAGLPGLLLHDLRRTAVRNMIRAGVPEKTAMLISGHRTRSVFDRYNIIDERDVQAVGNKMTSYFESQKVVTKPVTVEGDPRAGERGSCSEITGLAGATRRDRTGDLLITNQPLYQLS
jgi:integrase